MEREDPRNKLFMHAGLMQESLLAPVRRRNSEFGYPSFALVKPEDYEMVRRRASLRAENQITSAEAEQIRKKMLDIVAYVKKKNYPIPTESTVVEWKRIREAYPTYPQELNSVMVSLPYEGALQLLQTVWESHGEMIMFYTQGLSIRESERASTIVDYNVFNNHISFDIEVDNIPLDISQDLNLLFSYDAPNIPLPEISQQESALVTALLDFIDSAKT